MSGQDNFEQMLGKLIKKLDRRMKAVFLSSVVWGLLAHGMALFNKYSIHDDSASLFNVGITYTSGRWMLGVLNSVYLIIFGDSQYSIPLLNGLISIVYLAVSAYLIVWLLEIKRIGLCVSITGVLITFPVIMGMFGYMFTAPYYMLAVLFAVSGVFLVCGKRNILRFLSGTALMCFSIGVYQAFLPVMLSLFLIYYISRLSKDTQDSPKEFIISGIYYALSAVFSVVGYYLLNKLFLAFYHLSLSNYKGINTIESAPPSLYLSRIGGAYKHFFSLSTVQAQQLFPFNTKFLYVLILLSAAVLSINLIIKTFKKNVVRGVLMTISMLMLPAAFNFIYILCAAPEVHILMVYGQVMFFVYFAWLIDTFEPDKINISRIAYGFGLSSLILLSCLYCRYDNINYLKAEFEQQRAISYFTVMISRIKSTDGYKDELPVVYIDPNGKTDLTIREMKGFDLSDVPENYDIQAILNNHTWADFINNWCAFYPVYGNADDFKDLPEVIEMPCYPDDGSIKIINDTVVVKFGPVED